MIRFFLFIPACRGEALQQVFAFLAAPFALAACQARQPVGAALADRGQRLPFYPVHPFRSFL